VAFGTAPACNQLALPGVLEIGRALSRNDGKSPTKFLVKKGKKTMKRVLGIALALSTLGFVPVAETKAADVSHQNSTVAASTAPQWGRDRYGRRYDRRYDRRYRRRSVTQSRLVRYGRRLYRETYVVTYWPNGRTDTRLISRTRVG
jgi:hypothetical protein